MKKTIILSTLLLGLGVFLGVILVSNLSPDSIQSVFAQSNTKIGAPQAPIDNSVTSSQINNAMVEVSEAVIPTVVFVDVTTEGGGNERMREFFEFFDMPNDGRSRGSGSGVIISENGYIVTNNHVVENAIDGGIKIILHDKTEYRAELVGRDPLTDLAVLKIEAENLPTAHFGEIEDVKVGEFVIAVGNPLGLSSTVTAGIVSAIGRGAIGMRSSSYAVENYIQTDAAINPGNSGGGLFNLDGSLVGINTAIATRTGTYIGYGFAIPIDLTKSVVEDLIEDGEINRGYIGVSINTIRNDTEAKAYKLKKAEGAVIMNVLEDSPAEKAGLEKADVILEINGKPIRSSNELQNEVALYRAGDVITVTISRDGKIIQKDVKLKARSDDDTAFVDPEISSEEKNDKDLKGPIEYDEFGFVADNIPAELKNQIEVSGGVYIADVKRFSHASDQGLFRGGVIVEVDKKKVNNLKEFNEIIESKSPGDVFLMEVKYDSRNALVALEVPKK